MRVAIFSDVHGNLGGLEAVLADIERQGAGQVIFAGDLCLAGPRPADTLRLTLDRRIPSVIGNTDGWIAGLAEPPQQAAMLIEWSRGQLSKGEIARLAGLPFGLRISPTPQAADDLLIFHANPFNVNDLLYPSESDQIERYGEIRQSDTELKDRLGAIEAAMLAFGHLHIPGIRLLGSKTLVNVSSVSMPGDGDGRAKYAILEWAGGAWTAVHHYVVYDMQAEREAFISHRPPGWEEALASIDSQGYYSPQRI